MTPDEQRIAREIEALDPRMPSITARIVSRKPGHREGVRRHQRYGQKTLELGVRTLDPSYQLRIDGEVVETLGEFGPE